MLDGQTHLVKQGWKGTGHPLKAGGRSRPVVIAQKKTLGGIGKDRDESFAFWDHLYDVAAKSIKLKLPGDESLDDSDQEGRNPANTFRRTQTGILSNRRPTTLPTPSSSKSPTPPPSSASIMSLAKKEAARRALYSRFLRGPVITQEQLDSDSTIPAQTTSADSCSTPASIPLAQPVTVTTAATVPQASIDYEQLKKAEKTARRLAKEERRKARAAHREAKEERRKAKAIRDEARAAKEKRKVERAAKKAAKLERKREKEHCKAQAKERLGLEDTPPLAESGSTKEETERKKEKKRKRDGE